MLRCLILFLLKMVNVILVVLSFINVYCLCKLCKREFMCYKEGEARAVLFTISKVRKFKLDQIPFLLDSLNVIRAIKENENLILRSFVVDIYNLAKSYEYIEFQHLSRALNWAAHSIARVYFKFDVESKSFDNFSDWLFEQNS